MDQSTILEPKPLFYDEVNHAVTHVFDDGIFNLSSVANYEGHCKSFGFGIKFVTEGVERYQVNNSAFKIEQGNYLLVNGQADTKVQIDSKQHVKGICMHVSDDLISEVVASFVAPNSPFSNSELSKFFYTDEFLQNKYNVQQNHLGRKLIELEKAIRFKQIHEDDIQKDFFYELAIALVLDQTVVFKELQNIKSIKSETRKDLLKRVYKGKEFIDTCFEQPLTIEQIAIQAGMSEFHFFRLFRQVLGMSPYQYILCKRLDKAKSLLIQRVPVSIVAFEVGFSTIFTFSKSFKKVFGVAPSNLYNEDKKC